MFDWDNIIVEVDDKAVDLTAGEVALLIAADADTVSWGNIVGDYTQQADLMLAIDGKCDVDSPEFTGTPRTPTPPTGNISNRIANTEFVKTSIDGALNSLGDLAYLDTIDYRSAYITNKPTLGALASKNSVNFLNEVYNKPENTPSSFGALASKSSVDYETEVTNKPTLGALADHDTVNYATEVTNKPTLGALASKNTVDYSTDITNKPTLGALASKSKVDYDTDIINTPQNIPSSFGDLAGQDTVDYLTQITNIPEKRSIVYYDCEASGSQQDGSLDHPYNDMYTLLENTDPTIPLSVICLSQIAGGYAWRIQKGRTITISFRNSNYASALVENASNPGHARDDGAIVMEENSFLYLNGGAYSIESPYSVVVMRNGARLIHSTIRNEKISIWSRIHDGTQCTALSVGIGCLFCQNEGVLELKKDTGSGENHYVHGIYADLGSSVHAKKITITGDIYNHLTCKGGLITYGTLVNDTSYTLNLTTSLGGRIYTGSQS